MFISTDYNKENTEIEYKEMKSKYKKNIEVTKAFCKRAIVSLALYGRAPIEGIQRIFKVIFGMHISIGTISSVIKEASEGAAKFDNSIDLSRIKIGANDEIFQGREPVLTGIDLESLYVYLLEAASDRTRETWEIYMLDRKDHGLNLEETINDGAMGIMLGVSDVFGGIQIQLDVFHALMQIGKQIKKKERKAYSMITKEEKIKERIGKKRARKDNEDKLREIQAQVKEAVESYDKLQILLNWLRELLGFSGYGMGETKALVEYVLSEIETSENKNAELLKNVKGFRNNKEFVFTFITKLKSEMKKHSKEQGIPIEAYEMMYEQLVYDEKNKKYEEIEYKLVRLLMKDYDLARKDFKKLLSSVKRASSIVENLNSRIRTYMNVKRIVPTGFFVLMKVYFNTLRFRRSRIKERIGKSPLEILTGKKQPDFLEAIGF